MLKDLGTRGVWVVGWEFVWRDKSVVVNAKQIKTVRTRPVLVYDGCENINKKCLCIVLFSHRFVSNQI